jgi:hypothetical protein
MICHDEYSVSKHCYIVFCEMGWNYIELINKLHPSQESIKENQNYIKILDKFLILYSSSMDFHA